VNRIGDFGFLIAIFFIFATFNTFEYSTISDALSNNASIYKNSDLITIICLLLFLACTGKSAQLPLAVWLPDAMAGPTSVSALIHAATMVTSGIYLIARNSVMFALSPVASEIILIVGIATALFAAIAALSQNDIKKVLAYSTVSQLGFMFAAIGVGAYGVAVFHVVTHAFFKGLLFLGSGSVIHAMHEQQDIKMMGGLKKYLPTTYKTFLVGTLAISGIPLFSGFFSKDEIMWNVFSHAGPLYYGLLLIAAFMTAFYMFRLLYLTFAGRERFDVKHVKPHEAPSTMTVPLVILAIFSAVGGFLGIPYALGFGFSEHPNLFENYLEHIFGSANLVLGNSHGEVHAIEYLMMGIAVGFAVLAWYLARRKYSNYHLVPNEEKHLKRNLVYKLSFNKFYLDELYFYFIVDPLLRLSDKVIYRFFDKSIFDGILHGSAKIAQGSGQGARKIQTGYIPHYLALMVVGIVVVLFFVLMSI
jgi:NADH-quinone oxidoreductase subunit L